MVLTGAATLAVAGLVLAALTVLTVLGWSWLDRFGWGRWPLRAGLIGGCQLGAVLLAALLINDQFAFYQSWSELLGRHLSGRRPATAAGLQDGLLRPQLLAHFHAGTGTLVELSVPGLRSGVRTGPATVYLPPQYGDPATADRSFPVVELLSGYPGGPASWVRDLHIRTELDGLINSGRSAPFIAVIPVQNVASPRDTECVNVLGGPQVDSYLSYDVRTATVRAFRAAASGAQWTALGYSTGGYCAEDLAMRHPGMFSAAVSLAGYNSPAHDRTTRDLFGKQPLLARQFSPDWLLREHRVAPLHLLLVATQGDPLSVLAARQLIGLDRPPLQLSTLTLPWGGHNFATFAAELPVGFGWLSRYVSAPLAPIPTVEGQAVQPVPYRSQQSGQARQSGRSRPSRAVS